MRYFIHAVLGDERIEDREGSECADIYAALEEAESAAREIAAEELGRGRLIAANWHLDVVDASGHVHETVPFATLMTKTPFDLCSEIGGIKERILANYARSR